MKIFKILISIIAVLFLVIGCQSQETQVPALTDTATLEPTLTITPKANSTSTQAIRTSQPRTPIPTATPEDCTQGWTQLDIGRFAKIAGAENDPPNRVRSEPVKGENTIAQIYPGEIVKVIRGPVCADGLVFWKVENANIPGGAGWTAEGDQSEYWLEPYAYVPESVQLTAFGVSISVPGSWSNVPDAKIVGSGSDARCTWPEYTKIVLTTYPAQSGWKPEIYVWVTKDMPDWYPLFCGGGAPLLRIRQKMLPQGSRVLFHSTNAEPIVNSGLSYAYKGQTSDGKFSIYTIMPVNFPLLAYSSKDFNLPPGGIPFDMYDSEAYYEKVGYQLEGALDSDFTPNLELLDAIMESITVTRP